jgi:hypothetical protein
MNAPASFQCMQLNHFPSRIKAFKCAFLHLEAEGGPAD